MKTIVKKTISVGSEVSVEVKLRSSLVGGLKNNDDVDLYFIEESTAGTTSAKYIVLSENDEVIQSESKHYRFLIQVEDLFIFMVYG